LNGKARELLQFHPRSDPPVAELPMEPPLAS
jgi:hypothetical protein